MTTAVSSGIFVGVRADYQPEYSNPALKHFVFIYHITIENRSDYSVQLLRRRWLISDSDGTRKTVEGEGVVGLQPIIEPGQKHQYVSGCNLKTTMGKMGGTYFMERLIDSKPVEVTIPEFQMIAPFRFN
jgi:ApaG protein